MKDIMKKNEQITFRVSENDKRALTRLAEKDGRSLANYLRRAIQGLLESDPEYKREDSNA